MRLKAWWVCVVPEAYSAWLRLVGFAVGLWLLCSPALSIGAEDGVVTPVAVPASPAGDVARLEYRLTKTTRDEALAYWQASGARVLGRGYLALGSGSGVDNTAQAMDRDVELIDVAGIDFEGIGTARFIFNRGVLYGIQADLASIVNKRSNAVLNYAPADIKAVEAGLRAKYGKPQTLNSIFSGGDGKKPDILVWKVRGDTLTLVSNSLMASLRWVNKATETEVQKRRKEVCKTFNTPDRIICW